MNQSQGEKKLLMLARLQQYTYMYSMLGCISEDPGVSEAGFNLSFIHVVALAVVVSPVNVLPSRLLILDLSANILMGFEDSSLAKK